MNHVPAEEYDGAATIVLDDASGLEAQVRLRGHFEPIDGRFHWWGRLPADPRLHALANGTVVRLRTPFGEASGRLGDQDPWGRMRVTGTGRPPF